MTTWSVVRCPRGTFAVMPDDRKPGPVIAERGSLHGWTYPPINGGLTFEAACQLAADGNGKQSTANMGPRHAAEGIDL